MTEEYLYNITKRLSFTRLAGSEEFGHAADMIEGEVNYFGGEVQRQKFTFDYFAVDEVSLAVTAPYHKDYSAAGVGLSGDIDSELDFSYIEKASDFDI